MIEAVLIGYLANKLNIPVSGIVPSPMPQSFVIVEKIGSNTEDKIRRATLLIQDHAPTQLEAAALNERIVAAMAEFPRLPSISAADLEVDYNFFDEVLKRYRYFSSFEVTYFD